MIATHTGLFRVGPHGRRPERVAGLYQDTMGFTVVGPDHFLGSGHPGSVRDDPPFLALIESRNAGRQWRPISLRGEVDFRVLEAQGETVYGFGSDFMSREARFLRSDDGGRTWKRLAPPEILAGLAIDPTDPRHIVALGEERGYRSRDGGETFRPLPVPGLVTWTPSSASWRSTSRGWCGEPRTRPANGRSRTNSTGHLPLSKESATSCSLQRTKLTGAQFAKRLI